MIDKCLGSASFIACFTGVWTLFFLTATSFATPPRSPYADVGDAYQAGDVAGARLLLADIIEGDLGAVPEAGPLRLESKLGGLGVAANYMAASFRHEASIPGIRFDDWQVRYTVELSRQIDVWVLEATREGESEDRLSRTAAFAVEQRQAMLRAAHEALSKAGQKEALAQLPAFVEKASPAQLPYTVSPAPTSTGEGGFHWSLRFLFSGLALFVTIGAISLLIRWFCSRSFRRILA